MVGRRKSDDFRYGGGADQAANRVNRGGSWNNTSVNCRSANRNRNLPTNRNNNLGFRPVTAPVARPAVASTGTSLRPVPPHCE